jgi:hypothetical protein
MGRSSPEHYEKFPAIRGPKKPDQVKVPLHENEEPTVTLYAEASKVQAIFASQNPGFRLERTPVRSVESQIRLWGRNKSVREAAAKLLKDVRLNISSWPDEVDRNSAEAFFLYLDGYKIHPEPSNAAPGLSDHGRGLAVDFQVCQGRTVVADIVTSTIPEVWIAGGWLDKLSAAIRGSRLRGPLGPKPFEPWHWWLDHHRAG